MISFIWRCAPTAQRDIGARGNVFGMKQVVSAFRGIFCMGSYFAMMNYAEWVTEHEITECLSHETQSISKYFRYLPFYVNSDKSSVQGERIFEYRCSYGSYPQYTRSLDDFLCRQEGHYWNDEIRYPVTLCSFMSISENVTTFFC